VKVAGVVHKPKGSTIHSYNPLFVFKTRPCRCLPADPDVIVSGLYVKFADKVFPRRSSRWTRYGKRGDIHDGEFVEPMVIVYDPEGSVLLFNREGGGAISGR